jgi:hypothetical protein
MSSEQQINIPTKNDIVINPTSGRPVRVGGRTWLALVKQGLLSGTHRDPHELADIPDEFLEDQEYVNQKIKEINKTLPVNTQTVRGRGKYKNKLVSRRTSPTSESISRYTAHVASRAVVDNFDKLIKSDDLESMLENMILEEMMTTGPSSRPVVSRKKVGRPKKEECDGAQYQVDDAPEEDDIENKVEDVENTDVEDEEDVENKEDEEDVEDVEDVENEEDEGDEGDYQFDEDEEDEEDYQFNEADFE